MLMRISLLERTTTRPCAFGGYSVLPGRYLGSRQPASDACLGPQALRRLAALGVPLCTSGGQHCSRPDCNLNFKARWNVGKCRAPVFAGVAALRVAVATACPGPQALRFASYAWGSCIALFLFRGRARSALGGQAADPRRGPPDGGELRQAAGAAARAAADKRSVTKCDCHAHDSTSCPLIVQLRKYRCIAASDAMGHGQRDAEQQNANRY